MEMKITTFFEDCFVQNNFPEIDIKVVEK